MNYFPSLISGDLLHLADQINELETYCAGFHIDIMDFHFVPNLTWGPDFANAIRAATQKTLWVHLMVDAPEKYLDRLHLNHGDIVSVHYECFNDNNNLKKTLSIVRKKHWTASIALNPETPLEVIIPLIDSIDHVLLMSVNPGFSGQTFLPLSVKRLQKLHELKSKHSASFEIGMDGGLNLKTLPLVLPFGLDTIALASGIFDGSNTVERLKKLQNL